MSRIRLAAASLLVPLLVLGIAHPVLAFFDEIRIQEVLTAWDYDFDMVDNTDFQFVELRGLSIGASNIRNTVLAAFDANGTYIRDLAVVTVDLIPNRDDRILFATQQVMTETGFTDVQILPGLTASGMVCWGAPIELDPMSMIPFPPADPTTWDHSIPGNYIDCVAYGSFARAGTPVSTGAEGASLHRVFDSDDNDENFRCGTPSPQDLVFDSARYLIATTPCADPRFYTLGEPLSFSGTAGISDSYRLAGTIRPVHNFDGFSEFPSCESEFAPCFQPLGDTVFFTFEAGPDTDDVYGIGGIVTNDSPGLLSAIQAGWLHDDDPMSTLKEPFSGLIFGHMYNGFSRALTWFSLPLLVNGDQSTILFVTYPTGSVERANAAGGGFAAEAFAPPAAGLGSFETGFVDFVAVPEPHALPAQLAAIATLVVVAMCRRKSALGRPTPSSRRRGGDPIEIALKG